MTHSLRPITQTEHATLCWHRPTAYHFADTSNVAPLAAPEIAKAALSYALAFVPSGGHLSLVAMLGLKPDQNLFVDEAGTWSGPYIPAVLRAYPFSLTWTEQEGGVLSVDMASGLVQESSGETGEPFFDETGQPSASVQQILEFLRQVARGQEVLDHACALVHQQGILEPWPLTIEDEAGPRPVSDLYRVNEAALNALSEAGVLSLHRAGVLSLAYTQLLSMGNLAPLGQRAQARAQAEAAARARAEVKPLLDLPLDSNATWDWSRIGTV